MSSLEQEHDPDADWDPLPHEREWFDHQHTGDRGYRVRRNGKDCIRLDRPMEEIIKPFSESQWKADREHRPMTVTQVAQIAFEADRKLCFFMGHHERSRKEWASLTEKQRMYWMNNGPKEELRAGLYRAIFGVMREHFR